MTQTRNNQDDILAVKNIVDTARQEVELAVMFHETWRPAAYDTDLHTRIGTSYAAHAFQIIRLSLRRELIMALNRIWDVKQSTAIRMNLIADRLRDNNFFDALVQYRAEQLGLGSPHALDALREALTPKRNQVRQLFSKYMEGGAAFEVRKKLRTLRHQHLAHREVIEAQDASIELDTVHPGWVTDDEIEMFYQDTLEIMRLLLSLVQGMSFDLAEASSVYKHHAKYFWTSARGERTEGHPFFHPT